MLNSYKPDLATTNVANQLVRQVSEAIRSWGEADEADDRARLEILEDRLETIAREISWHQAESAAVALFQTCVAIYVADDIRDALECRNGRGVDIKSARLERLLGSVIRFIENESGTRREDYGLDWYRTDRCEALSAWGVAEVAA